MKRFQRFSLPVMARFCAECPSHRATKSEIQGGLANWDESLRESSQFIFVLAGTFRHMKVFPTVDPSRKRAHLRMPSSRTSPLHRGASLTPTSNRAEKSTTASRLARPSFAQYTSRKLSQRANSSSVSAAPAP